MRPCLTCGALSFGSRCKRCSRDRANALYGVEHRRLRAYWAPLVARGDVVCRRCHELIEVSQAWDVGHKPGDVSAPEHAKCNRVAGGASEG